MDQHDHNSIDAVAEFYTPRLTPLAPAPPPRRARRYWLPLLLFLLTVASTFYCRWVQNGFVDADGRRHSNLEAGVLYCGALMTILLAHELGHFFQALRYKVPASLPYFLPMPISPIGTMGAVIAMQARFGNRKSLFDIGISGPLAGLLPALLCCVWGVRNSPVVQIPPSVTLDSLGEPLLFQWLAYGFKGPLPPHHEIILHPIGFAGWVGLLITSLNLMPIGQLDGGHILYALLHRRSGPIALLFLLAAIGAVAWGYTMWAVFVMMLCMMGPGHAPTANDAEPLGWPRHILGWLTLAFVPIGFTPDPFNLP